MIADCAFADVQLPGQFLVCLAVRGPSDDLLLAWREGHGLNRIKPIHPVKVHVANVKNPAAI